MKISKILAALLVLGSTGILSVQAADVGKWSDLQKKIDSASAGEVIRLTADMTWGSRSDITISKQITIDGQGHKITRPKNYATRCFSCSSGADVTFTRITLDGSSQSSQTAMIKLSGTGAKLTFGSGAVLRSVVRANGQSLFNTDTTTAPITMTSGTTLTLSEGSIISNCTNNVKSGGAINNAGGTVVLAGGSIVDCATTGSSLDGGAIYSTGTVTMSAGSITGCQSANGGAVYSTGTFTMTGGAISGCTAKTYGGAICSAGTATLDGVALTDCTVTAGSGGAIYSTKTLGLTDVTVTGCTVSSFGGAVYTTGTLNLAGNLTLSDNRANGVICNIQPDSEARITQTGDLMGSVGVTFAQEEGARFGTYASGAGAEVFFNDRNHDLVGEVSGSTLVWKDNSVVRFPGDGLTFEEALARAAARNGCVTIVSDVTADLVVPANYDITIDLAGCKVTGGIEAKGRVTITDSSTDKSGEVTGELRTSGGAFSVEYGTYATDPANWLAADRIEIANYDGTFTVTATSEKTATETMAMDTRAGQVRVVNDPATDLLPFTYASGDFVDGASEDASKLTGVYAIPVAVKGAIAAWHADTNTVASAEASDGSYDYAADSEITATESALLLSEKPYEAEFNWQEVCYGLIQVVHSNANGRSVAYFKFPDPAFDVLQRSSVTNAYSIVINDAMLQALGYSRIGKMNKQDVENHFNARQTNGLRVWENLVTGVNPTNAYVGDVNSVAAKDTNLTIRMPGANPDTQYGYRVLYQLRKATNEWVAASDTVTASGVTIPLTPSATGLYRLYTLLVPDSNPAITNEIASANTIGVLCVESSATNTMVAVPWRALATDPAQPTDIVVSNYVRTAGLDDDDALMALDPATDKYETWTLFDGNWEAGMTITDKGILHAGDPEHRTLARGQGFWLAREQPLDADGKVRPFYLVGQFDAGDVTTVVKGGTDANPGFTMLGAPGISSVKINDIAWGSNPLPTDVITIPLESGLAPMALTWRDGAWGYSKTAFDPKTRKVVSTRVTDIEVPAGTAFWYARRGAEFSFTWALSWPEAK